MSTRQSALTSGRASTVRGGPGRGTISSCLARETGFVVREIKSSGQTSLRLARRVWEGKVRDETNTVSASADF